jgi:hypothetical protein
MRAIAEMGGPHHSLQRHLDRLLGVGEEIRDSGQSLVGLCVEQVQNRAN